MTNEVLIGRLYDIIDEVTRLGGEQERTSIVPGILVADANPSDLPTGYIKIVNPRDGTYVPCLTVNGLVVSDNDLVNVLFTKGTEPIALSQSSGSPSSSVKVSELWESDFGAVAWQTNAAGHLSATGKDLTTTGDISANDVTVSGNVLLTSGGTEVAGSGSSNPSLGTEASDGRWGNIFVASGTQINTLASLDISAGAIGSEVVMIRLNNTAQDALYLGAMPSSGADVDINLNDGQVFIEGSSGGVGIGTETVATFGENLRVVKETSVATTQLGVSVELTSTFSGVSLTGSHRAMSFSATLSGSGGGSGNMFGILGDVFNEQTSGTFSLMEGIVGQVRITDAATTTTGKGLRSGAVLTSTGNLTNWRGVSLESPNISGSGGITTAYGVYIARQSVTGVGTGWGVYQADSNDNNLLNGATGIGASSIAAKLHVDQASTTAAIPVATFDQADLSEEFFEFISTVGAGNPIDTAAIGTYYGKIRVSVAGVGFKYIPLHNS